MALRDRIINYELDHPFPRAARAEGVYIWDEAGKRYLDGCGGALVANLGHGLKELGRAMTDQLKELDFVYRYHFSCAKAEELAERYCHLTEQPMGRVFFVNSGSEANEAAVRLARNCHQAAGRPGRHKVISRWQSYHGATMGALAWTGHVARREDYQPYLQETIHIPPAYCYRCWFGQNPASCDLNCAAALENAILTAGPDTVAAFMAEPVVGSALAGAVPPEAYFQAVRDICDRYGVFWLSDEVMTGAGRTGKHFFGGDHFPGRADFISFGKGVGGGYYPLAGVLISPEAAEILETGPGFGSGQSHSGHPLGLALGAAVLDFMDRHNLLSLAEQRGNYLARRLAELTTHPILGDIRGKGLMLGLEFVRDKKTKQTLDPALAVHNRFYQAAREQGLLVLPSAGCDRGRAGDGALLGPPLTITEPEMDQMVKSLDLALNLVEEELGF